MPKVEFRCRCVNECVALGIARGMIYSGTILIDEYGCTIFVIDLTCGGPLKWCQELFVRYFRIIE